MAKRTIRIERLAKREEKAVIRRIFFLSSLSIILAIFLLTVGVSLLGKFTDLLGVVFRGKDNQSSNTTSVLAPVFDDLPEATNSTQLAVSGFASNSESVEIYLDGEKVGEAQIDGTK